MELRSYARRSETGRLTSRTIVADVVRSHGLSRIRVKRGEDFVFFEDTAIVVGPGDVIGLRDARLLDLRVQRASKAELTELRQAGYNLPPVA